VNPLPHPVEAVPRGRYWRTVVRGEGR
jgi:hypothetical protein